MGVELLHMDSASHLKAEYNATYISNQHCVSNLIIKYLSTINVIRIGELRIYREYIQCLFIIFIS